MQYSDFALIMVVNHRWCWLITWCSQQQWYNWGIYKGISTWSCFWMNFGKIGKIYTYGRLCHKNITLSFWPVLLSHSKIYMVEYTHELTCVSSNIQFFNFTCQISHELILTCSNITLSCFWLVVYLTSPFFPVIYHTCQGPSEFAYVNKFSSVI